MPYGLDEINAMTRDGFVRALGGVFEHSPWVAEGAWASRPFASTEALQAAMCAVVRGAADDAKLALLRAHPDLAGRAAVTGELTAASKGEQQGAGLDRLTAGEHARFTELNDAYKAKFGFPFILAVKGADKHTILAAFEARIGNSREVELQTALAQVERIAGFRLADLVR